MDLMEGLRSTVRRAIPSIVAAGLLSLVATPAPAESVVAQKLLIETYRNLYEGNFVQIVRLTSRSQTGRAVTRRLQIVRKGSDPPGRAIVRFLSPPDVRGTSMLVIDRDERADDVFIFLPAFRRTKRISSAQRYDSFFGTNLTYEDLEPKDPNDFQALIEGQTQADGIDCMLMRVRPKPGVKSQYASTLSCVDPDRAVPLWTEYYLEQRLIKRLVSDPSGISRISERFIPKRTQLFSMASDFETEIIIESYETRSEIPEHLFTTWNLEGGNESTDVQLLGRSEERQ